MLFCAVPGADGAACPGAVCGVPGASGAPQDGAHGLPAAGILLHRATVRQGPHELGVSNTRLLRSLELIKRRAAIKLH